MYACEEIFYTVAEYPQQLIAKNRLITVRHMLFHEQYKFQIQEKFQ